MLKKKGEFIIQIPGHAFSGKFSRQTILKTNQLRKKFFKKNKFMVLFKKKSLNQKPHLELNLKINPQTN